MMQPMTQLTLSAQAVTQLSDSIRANKKYAPKYARRNTDPTRFRSISQSRKLNAERATTVLGKARNVLVPQGWRDQRKLAIVGIGGSGQNRHVSDQATNPAGRDIFFNPMFQKLSEVHSDESVSMYFVTIVNQDWCLPKGAESFDREKMMRGAMRAMRDIGCEGLFFLEIQPVLNMRDIQYLPHLHGFVWYPNGKTPMGPKAVKAKLKKRFTALGTAKAVEMTKIRHDHPQALAQRFFYATKLPDTAKSFCPTLDGTGIFKKAASKNYSDREAARVLRLLAQFKLEETVFAVGDGCKIRKAGSKALDAAADRLGHRFSDGLSAEQVLDLFVRASDRHPL